MTGSVTRTGRDLDAAHSPLQAVTLSITASSLGRSAATSKPCRYASTDLKATTRSPHIRSACRNRCGN
jgi:hypothetical protein